MSAGCTKKPCIHDLAAGDQYRAVVSSDPGRIRTKSDGNYDGVTCFEVVPVPAPVVHTHPDGGTNTVTFQNDKDRTGYLAELAKHEPPAPRRAVSSTGTVIGCVHGAWSALAGELDDPPSYDWCEATWAAHRKDAPRSGQALADWTLDLLRRHWTGSPDLELSLFPEPVS